MKKKLLSMYDKLYKAYGPQHWWPADTPFEVIVGAILTQNAAWTNVEKAIANIRARMPLTVRSLAGCREKRLARLIRPAGYFNVKAKRLGNFLGFLARDFGGDLDKLFKVPTGRLRTALLGVNGIGEETADSILLYAAKRPVFVVDAYTRRALSRHGMIGQDAPYGEIQRLFTENLPRSARLFNEYHALIVRLGKEHCRTRPLCDGCPIRGI